MLENLKIKELKKKKNKITPNAAFYIFFPVLISQPKHFDSAKLPVHAWGCHLLQVLGKQKAESTRV